MTVARPTAAVLDASVAAPWFLPDEASEASDGIYALVRRGSLRLHAPELWLWECGNIIASAVKQQRIAVDDALLAWDAVDSVRVRLVLAEPQPSYVAEAMRLALTHGLSVYDAAYLRLAHALGLPLLTADRGLGRAASASGVSVLTAKDFG